MDKYCKVLMYLNYNPFKSQRALASGVNMSIGQINALLKEMKELELLEIDSQVKQLQYKVTKKGATYLAEHMQQSSLQRIELSKGEGVVKTAVILAAGSQTDLQEPVGLLTIQGTPIIDILLHQLEQAGIEHVILVVGYKKERYQEYLANKNITVIENVRYKWTGTMESLACAKKVIDTDMLVIDMNQIFDYSALSLMLESKEDNAMLLVTPSGSHDEAYVELNENGSIFRISKDIRQLNSIDAELVGVSKISYPLYEKMMQYFDTNKNPLLNYEYVIENIGRIYKIQGVMANDLVWTVIESKELYYKAENIIYPKIKKREQLRIENNAKATLLECMKWKEEEIQDFGISGGMTNTNFYVVHNNKKYILRIPGACTDEMINRKGEKHNDALAYSMGINPLTIYFNEKTGVKVTEFIVGAETLSGKIARLEETMKKTTSLLRTLHNSEMHMYGSFRVQDEFEKYKNIAKQEHASYYPGFEDMEAYFYKLLERLQQLGIEQKPCHNDLVPENFVESKSGKLYLIDWEYAGYNDPMWDLAAHLLECEFTKDEEELFLNHYFKGEATTVHLEKIIIYKMLQDILWSLWTITKEVAGEDFGTYGIDRLKRAERMKGEYETSYK